MTKNKKRKDPVFISLGLIVLAVLLYFLYMDNAFWAALHGDDHRQVFHSGYPDDTGIFPTPTSNSPAQNTPVQVAPDPFSDNGHPSNMSNVVGYFAYGAFLTTLPDWLSDHWKSVPGNSADDLLFTPQDQIQNRDFSDIIVTVWPTDETTNAENLYDKQIDPRFELKEVITKETILNNSGDTYIYHIQELYEGKYYDTYYLDGVKKTAKVEFSSTAENFLRYSAKIKEFVQGLSGSVSRG